MPLKTINTMKHDDIPVSDLGLQWLCWWLVACLTPSHQLNQCWLSGGWPFGITLKYIFNLITEFCFKKMLLKWRLKNTGHFVQGQMGYQPVWCWARDISGELSQYRSCWCPGAARSQGISSHGIVCTFLVVHEEEFQIPVSSRCWDVITIAYIISITTGIIVLIKTLYVLFFSERT